jgi:hypothetical protein
MENNAGATGAGITKPSVLTDFKGSPSEVLHAKAQFIQDYGFKEYEQVVLRSGKHYSR